ncbi:GNAT family N-acetyltransferase [Tistrella sp.]|nr:GNAT family N-acetyltransferase [Tistrella sp.]|tara:strand:- start:343 stop:864 length:522 start_codon:yes stop_codon:yes gene_type:complete
MRHAHAPWQIAPRDSRVHDRSAFSCGAPALDRYIREHASQDVKRDVARVFVAMPAGTLTVCGYYSLSATSFRRDNLPAGQAKRLPGYPVPAALLGRLAVDDGMRGKGLGAFLLMDALNRILLATQTLAIHAVVIDAKDDAAAAFYRKYGFISFMGESRRLFLPMATIRRLIEA